MALNQSQKNELAKTLTELAIQHDLIQKKENADDVANEIVTFYNIISNKIGNSVDE